MLSSRPHVVVALFTFMGIGVVSASACDGGESALVRLGDGCLLNSDCDEGLSCVFRRCHIQCASSQDCPVADDGKQLRCVIGEKPEHVCQLADERDCSYHSECPGLQRCGPDGACRDQCLDDRDCVEGQTCTAQGVCADLVELDGQGALAERPAPGEQETGFPCAYDSQCVGKGPEGGPELVCRNGGCAFGCYATVDCDPSFVCMPDDGDSSTPGKCEPAAGGNIVCVPGLQQYCQCFPSGPGVQVCNDTGTGFEPCLRATGMGGSGAEDCSPPE